MRRCQRNVGEVSEKIDFIVDSKMSSGSCNVFEITFELRIDPQNE